MQSRDLRFRTEQICGAYLYGRRPERERRYDPASVSDSSGSYEEKVTAMITSFEPLRNDCIAAARL
jgi:hypothetical protein